MVLVNINLLILAVAEKEGIEDRTQTNLVNLRRIIYLTIMNALSYEEAVHKLLKVQIKEGEEVCQIEMLLFYLCLTYFGRLNYVT